MKSETLAQTLTAGQWALANTLVQKSLSIGTFFMLARILLPEDFGIIALAVIVPNFIEGVTALAFDTAAVQKQGDIRHYLNAIWTYTIVRGLAIFVVVFFSAPYVAAFFHVSHAEPLLRLAGLIILLQSFMNIGQIYFSINLDFKKLFIRDCVLNISYAVTAILLALVFRSYWALFLGTLLSIVAVLISTYVLHPYRPRFDFNFRKLRDLLPFSQWLLGQEVLNQLVRTLEEVLIGRFTNAAALGIYGKAKALASAPTSPISSLINKVSFVSYAREQNVLPLVREGVHKSFELMLAIALPFYLAILMTGDRIVLVLLGENWVGITPYLQVLTLAATIEMLFVSLATPVFNAIGLPRIQFFLRGVAAVTVISGLAFLVPLYGIWGAAITSLLGSSVTALVTLYVLTTRLKLDIGRMAIGSGIVAISCLVPLILAGQLLTMTFFNTTGGYLALLLLTGGIYSILIILLSMLTKRGPYPTLHLILHSFMTTSAGRRIARWLPRFGSK